MEVAARQICSQSKAEQQGANYVQRSRIIHHSLRHLSSLTKESAESRPASRDRDDAH
ncbi:hypothetical protein JOB18_010807 [Solea senegalensis]|uniref:Uncharacterized protein n=1 Tax=Solea senegalensis TaxID=28829 RepID=A0AAV6RTZ0_SOLSE|nr:hypothetical protein JOB18_010807 [Solea senegalensis]